MHRASPVILSTVLVLAGGCRTRPLDEPVGSEAADLALIVDLGSAVDDASIARDSSVAIDLSVTVDASTTSDLATLRDLSAARDLSTLKDLSIARDLTTPADLSLVDLAHPTVDGGPDGGSCGIVFSTGSRATTYQINPAHDGVQAADPVAMPLCRRWMTLISGALSYPVVANGGVYLTATETIGTGGFPALRAQREDGRGKVGADLARR